MPFPESPRAIYAKNPLQEVVVQLRFSPILRILNEAPYRFQDAVRATFPIYARQSVVTGLALPAGVLPPEVLQMIAGANQPPHEFRSADGSWTLTLNQDFLALSTKRYTRWTEFKGALEGALAALREFYQPPFFTRVGLRYRDRIDRADLGLDGVEWKDLLAPAVLGELADADVGPAIEHMLHEIVIKLSGVDGRVRVVHGLDQGGRRYLIDSDFFLEGQIQTGVASNVLDSYNQRAGRLFRWCILPRLHDAMGPSSS